MAPATIRHLGGQLVISSAVNLDIDEIDFFLEG